MRTHRWTAACRWCCRTQRHRPAQRPPSRHRDNSEQQPNLVSAQRRAPGKHTMTAAATANALHSHAASTTTTTHDGRLGRRAAPSTVSRPEQPRVFTAARPLLAGPRPTRPRRPSSRRRRRASKSSDVRWVVDAELQRSADQRREPERDRDGDVPQTCQLLHARTAVVDSGTRTEIEVPRPGGLECSMLDSLPASRRTIAAGTARPPPRPSSAMVSWATPSSTSKRMMISLASACLRQLATASEATNHSAVAAGCAASTSPERSRWVPRGMLASSATSPAASPGSSTPGGPSPDHQVAEQRSIVDARLQQQAVFIAHPSSRSRRASRLASIASATSRCCTPSCRSRSRRAGPGPGRREPRRCTWRRPQCAAPLRVGGRGG